MRVQRNQDDQRWKYRTYHLRRLCRHHLKNLSFSSHRRFRGIDNSRYRIFELSKRSIQIFGDSPVPLFWSLSLPRRLSNSGWTESFSSFMWTPARTPVPKFSVIIWIFPIRIIFPFWDFYSMIAYPVFQSEKLS